MSESIWFGKAFMWDVRIPIMTQMNTQISSDDSSTILTASPTVDWNADSESTPMYAVVSAVAEAEGVDVVELPPLYDTIDPEALNALFTSQDDAAVSTVEFEYAGYTVVVRGESTVEVRSSQA